jgi:hypothetical protein
VTFEAAGVAFTTSFSFFFFFFLLLRYSAGGEQDIKKASTPPHPQASVSCTLADGRRSPVTHSTTMISLHCSFFFFFFQQCGNV